MARPAGIEPTTKNLEGSCSIQLSYGRTRQGAEPSRVAHNIEIAPHAVKLCGAWASRIMLRQKTATKLQSQGCSWANFTARLPAHLHNPYSQRLNLSIPFTEPRHSTAPKPAANTAAKPPHNLCWHTGKLVSAQACLLAHRLTRCALTRPLASRLLAPPQGKFLAYHVLDAKPPARKPTSNLAAHHVREQFCR